MWKQTTILLYKYSTIFIKWAISHCIFDFNFFIKLPYNKNIYCIFFLYWIVEWEIRKINHSTAGMSDAKLCWILKIILTSAGEVSGGGKYLLHQEQVWRESYQQMLLSIIYKYKNSSVFRFTQFVSIIIRITDLIRLRSFELWLIYCF